MKRNILSALLVLVFQSMSSQNAYYDALYLSTLSRENISTMIKVANDTNMIFTLTCAEKENLYSIKSFLLNPFDDDIGVENMNM